ERRADRTQRIVSVSARCAKQRHCRVADVLVDDAAVAIDGRIDDGEEPLEQSVDFLRVQRRRQPRIADKVAEHDRDGTSVAEGGSTDLGESVAFATRTSAAAAESIGGLVDIAALRARAGERGAAGCAE